LVVEKDLTRVLSRLLEKEIEKKKCEKNNVEIGLKI